MRVSLAKQVFSLETISFFIAQAESDLHVLVPYDTLQVPTYLKSANTNFDKCKQLSAIRWLQNYEYPKCKRNALQTAEYLAVVSGLFTQYFLNSKENITMDNILNVKSYVSELMQYFVDWRANSIRQKSSSSFIATQTWSNLQTSVYGFVNMAEYILKLHENRDLYVPVLYGNSSSLEAAFAHARSIQGHNSLTVTNYTDSVCCMNIKAARSQLLSNSSYDKLEVVPEKMQTSNEKNTATPQLQKQLESILKQIENVPEVMLHELEAECTNSNRKFLKLILTDHPNLYVSVLNLPYLQVYCAVSNEFQIDSSIPTLYSIREPEKINKWSAFFLSCIGKMYDILIYSKKKLKDDVKAEFIWAEFEDSME